MVERRLAVAYSGGRDSTALLHATAHEAATLGVQVLALHIHHGLSPHADAWLQHCEVQCKRWARRGLPIHFFAHRLTDKPGARESVEAWARDARYRALRTLALEHEVDVVLLAHHRRDQAETFLLQALRGAGVAGLSSMPESIERDGVFWKRPWLRRSRDEIDAYVRRHRIKHIEDDSNADPRFARNRLRLDVWPALVNSFDSAETTLAMAASWAHEASDALDELAAIDLARIAVHDALQIDAWLELSQARRSNALRAWIKLQGGHASASLLTRLLDELPIRRNARWPLAASELRAYRGVLRYRPSDNSLSLRASDSTNSRQSVDPLTLRQSGNSLSPRERAGVRASALAPTTVATPDLAPRESQLSIRRAGTYALTRWSGSLRVERVRKNGVPVAWLAHLELRERSGGEQFQAGIDRPPRSLKKQFQQAGVPMWERTGPLVYSGGQLVFVPGLGLDARVIGLPGQAMATLHWVPTVAPV